jgi:chorismate mutase
MSYTPPDYQDDLNRALGIVLDTDDSRIQAGAAIAEVKRLQGIEKFIRDNRERIIVSLEMLADSDQELGHPDEAKKSRDLMEQLKALPEFEPFGLEEEEEEEDEDAGS